jgi:hypothetical protein
MKAVKTDQPVKIPAHIAWRKVGDEIVVLDLNTSIYWSLNELAGFIWELLSQGMQEKDIVSQVCDHYDVSEKVSEKDVRAYLDDLAKEGLVQ